MFRGIIDYEFKKLFIRRNIIILIVLFIFLAFLCWDGIGDYKKIEANKKPFQEMERDKVSMHLHYTFYGVRGVRLLYIPGPFIANQCDEGDGVSTQTLSIGQLIIEVGGYFLQSNSYQHVLKRIELSEKSIIDSIDQTIQNISNANAFYIEIWETSKSLEYDPMVLERLYKFDYTGYQIENNLNPTIFQQVEEFLKPGHVREVLKKHFEDSSAILEKLKEIQTNLESDKKVDISKYWRLNQLYLEFALFGQYTSEVFIKI